MGELGIVVRQFLFKPEPVGLSNLVENFHEARCQCFAQLIDEPIAAEAPKVFVNPDQNERPGARGSKLGHRWKGLREEFSGHYLEAAMRRSSDSRAQSPKSPGMAVFGPLFIQPAAVKTETIVEALRFGIKSVIDERGVGSSQRPN